MDILERVAQLLARGEALCLVTTIAGGDGVGRKLLVRGDGAAEGSLGDPGLDEAAREQGLSALRTRRSGPATLPGGVEVLLDAMTGEARLLVCGAGHIAVPLARYARDAGFTVTVLDDRPDFAHPSRFPGCQVVDEDFVPALRARPPGPSDYVVVITRGHEHDVECLAEVLRHDTAYVGLIGSRRRVAFVRELLARQGAPAERLAALFTPIGLPIGAESPEEIALSIAAELVCVRRKGAGHTRSLRGEEEGR